MNRWLQNTRGLGDADGFRRAQRAGPRKGRARDIGASRRIHLSCKSDVGSRSQNINICSF